MMVDRSGMLRRIPARRLFACEIMAREILARDLLAPDLFRRVEPLFGTALFVTQ
jgi:hypothetical protein